MSSTPGPRSRFDRKHTDICINNISFQTNPHALLAHFEKFGTIIQYNFTSPNCSGYVFISYEDSSMVDACMKARPHRLDDRTLFVKRALPVDPEHPRERFDSIRDLIIALDVDHDYTDNQQFLKDLRTYFSSYGPVYGCKYCQEETVDYIHIEFADPDQVDRIILDKPHYLGKRELNVMKYLPSNLQLIAKQASRKVQSTIIRDAIDDDDESFRSQRNGVGNSTLDTISSYSDERISEIDLANEVDRLKNVIKRMSEEFTEKRQQLEKECCEKLNKLNENAERTNRLQQDLEQEHNKLLAEYESCKRENEALNDQYLMTELENFEITCHYEQLLADEQAKTTQLEAEYTQKLVALHADSSPPPPPPPPPRSVVKESPPSTSPLLPAIPDDD